MFDRIKLAWAALFGAGTSPYELIEIKQKVFGIIDDLEALKAYNTEQTSAREAELLELAARRKLINDEIADLDKEFDEADSIIDSLSSILSTNVEASE